MGLFDRNKNDVNFAGGSKNIMESIQRGHDVNALIYLDAREDFNTNSVITVAPNEQVIFIKNGEFYGTLPSGRHEIKNENYPLFSRIRNMLSGGMSTFTCQVYHVNISEQNILWGTSTPIQIQDFSLGRQGIPTLVRGGADFCVRFNINDNDDASKQTFMRLMGDKSMYTANDLSKFIHSTLSQKIHSVVGKSLQDISMRMSINGISGMLEDFSDYLMPVFTKLFEGYGLELIRISFTNLTIEDTEERRKWRERLNAADHTSNTMGYNQAIQQELLDNISLNSGAGGIASAGAGLGMGMAAGNAFATIATTAFTQPQQPVQPQPQGFGSQNRFGIGQPSQQSSQMQPDPMETLMKMKQMLEAGLISQQQYDKKVEEVMNRM